MADTYDEIEALVLGPPSEMKKSAAKSSTAKLSTAKSSIAKPSVTKLAVAVSADTKATNPLTPLIALFEAILIRIMGTVDDPLFCASDVATYIGDAHNYIRAISKFTAEFTLKVETITARGQARPTLFLTEAGVYKYLLQAKGEKAEEFQHFVYKLLKEERKRTVDSIQLALKIERSKTEVLQREKTLLQRNEARLYKAANDAREINGQQARQIAVLQRAKNAAEDAAYLRSMGRGHLVEESETEENEGDEDNEGDEGD
jgi:prophage antirepressor-like protein